MTDGKKNPFGHLALLASAGSGKTTRLCHRYIRLLADGDLKVTPDRICALTFTRKAAGEIFDRVVECLCAGAGGGEKAAGLAGDLGMPGLGKDSFAGLLRLFLDNLHRAVIGTMDSFVGGVVRAFPIELGIPLEFEVSESNDAAGKALRQDIFADILAAPGAGASELLEAFKKATFGVEEKSFERFLNEVVVPLHLSYRFCPDRTKWGNADLVWTGKGKPPSKLVSGEELSAQATTVEQWVEEQIEDQDSNNKFLDILLGLAGVLAAHGLATPWSVVFKGVVFDRLLEQRGDLRQGAATIQYGKSMIPLPAAAAKALAVLVDNLVAVEIKRALEKTVGLHGLLGLYDRAYEKNSRESGRFTFTDLQYLLAPGDGSRGVLPISRERAEGRLFIDYRMDGRLDHWLLDEFQDTGDLQWAIFSNLVSELVQGDPAGRERSFFYVGDVKQSIYRWRGGNPGLFLDILEQYNRPGKEVIALETMQDTRRCSQPVIDAVNKVFADLPPASLPTGTIAKWRTVWGEHGTLNKKAKGYVALLQHGDADDPEKARCRLVADLLNEIQPGRRGILVGILTRTNEACSELVNILRRECQGMAFVHEGKAGIARNELTQAMLALVRLAAHPGDEFAWQYVRMSPLAGVLDDKKITRSRIAPLLLTEIEGAGFQPFIAGWGSRLEAACPLNEFGRQCLARLEKAAAGFDVSGSRSCNRFLEFVGDYEVHEEAARGAVRIMTIHQAKGLGFDVVILPELQHKTRMNMVSADWKDKQILYGGKPFDPGWILKSPKNDIAGNDPVLGARLRKIDEDHSFDQLCILYVAMTRAKNALYMITSPTKDSKTFRPASLLKLQLAGSVDADAAPNVKLNGKPYARLYAAAAGDERWYESESFSESPDRETAAGPAAAAPPDFSKRKSGRQVLKRSAPSRQESFERRASDLFDPESRDVLDFGSAIHELFEKIEWLDAKADAEATIKNWLPSSPYDQKVHDDVLEQFRKCMQSAEVREALARPAGNAELWREKKFEIILDGKWVSGIFDRVVITRDAAGLPAAAAILDFKSNRDITTEAGMKNKAAQYKPQMELYRRALAGSLGLAENKISIQLLFTVPARIIILNSDR